MSKDLARLTKLQVWARDGYRCAYCGTEVIDVHRHDGNLPSFAATVDHIIPISKPEGTDKPENLITCCFRCNNLLGDQFDTVEAKKSYIEAYDAGFFLVLNGDAIKKWERHVEKKALHRRRRG